MLKTYQKPSCTIVTLDDDPLMVDFDPTIPLSGDPLTNRSNWDEDLEEEDGDDFLKDKTVDVWSD